jgi:hypothetical protein
MDVKRIAPKLSDCSKSSKTTCNHQNTTSTKKQRNATSNLRARICTQRYRRASALALRIPRRTRPRRLHCDKTIDRKRKLDETNKREALKITTIHYTFTTITTTEQHKQPQRTTHTIACVDAMPAERLIHVAIESVAFKHRKLAFECICHDRTNKRDIDERSDTKTTHKHIRNNTTEERNDDQPRGIEK